MNQLRMKAGLLALILFAVYQSLAALNYYEPHRAYLNFKKNRSLFSDFLVQYKEDLSCPTMQLSAGDVLGFTTSVPDKKQKRAAIFHMTQFAITPALLEDSLSHPLVLAYYPNSIKPKPEIPTGFGLQGQCTEEILLLVRNAK